MDLAERLIAECVKSGSAATAQEEVLQELASLVCQHPALGDAKEKTVFKALKDREEMGTTAFGNGIAIPHCSLPDVSEFCLALMTVPNGAEFKALDEQPVKLFAVIVGPSSKRNIHVTVLSGISKILNDKKAVKECLSQTSSESLRESFLRFDSNQEQRDHKEKVMVHVIIQDEGKFSDILTIFSSSVAGDISVIEAQSAGIYLNRMPMFASFWNNDDDQRGYCRVIQAIIDKTLLNDVIRRIHLEVEDLDNNSGVMIAAHDLLIVRGSLDF